jgi:hypothetical protein
MYDERWTTCERYSVHLNPRQRCQHTQNTQIKHVKILAVSVRVLHSISGLPAPSVRAGSQISAADEAADPRQVETLAWLCAFVICTFVRHRLLRADHHQGLKSTPLCTDIVFLQLLCRLMLVPCCKSGSQL